MADIARPALWLATSRCMACVWLASHTCPSVSILSLPTNDVEAGRHPKLHSAPATARSTMDVLSPKRPNTMPFARLSSADVPGASRFVAGFASCQLLSPRARRRGGYDVQTKPRQSGFLSSCLSCNVFSPSPAETEPHSCCVHRPTPSTPARSLWLALDSTSIMTASRLAPCAPLSS
ncbi:uncharacterized protein K452DRAFT_144843 [Aplosporella prunicola CBS 121167]|uniref:Secreted protein n=1 Tax=Aplosporella prunicola CBS 121167 TaxID=1176127 RepID=A0A6A6BKI5_9PEZI|nr:uncharacterized protein K452DRAFT_144843 [Aplosporella prunicola CBS 121167]KAF2144630.1 hypothetical protein K452DRAFT_144843 [Aplosporella prunicola CBS 121167]